MSRSVRDTRLPQPGEFSVPEPTWDPKTAAAIKEAGIKAFRTGIEAQLQLARLALNKEPDQQSHPHLKSAIQLLKFDSNNINFEEAQALSQQLKGHNPRAESKLLADLYFRDSKGGTFGNKALSKLVAAVYFERLVEPAHVSAQTYWKGEQYLGEHPLSRFPGWEPTDMQLAGREWPKHKPKDKTVVLPGSTDEEEENEGDMLGSDDEAEEDADEDDDYEEEEDIAVLPVLDVARFITGGPRTRATKSSVAANSHHAQVPENTTGPSAALSPRAPGPGDHTASTLANTKTTANTLPQPGETPFSTASGMVGNAGKLGHEFGLGEDNISDEGLKKPAKRQRIF
jgi:hypothetical protein